VPQAKMLGELLAKRGQSIDKVVQMDIADELLEERITGRWIHKPSGRSYHVKFAPPKVEGKDDVTGEPLIQRSDDKADKVKTRLQAYHDQTEPVLEYYRAQGKVEAVNADQPQEKVWGDLVAAVEGTRQ